MVNLTIGNPFEAVQRAAKLRKMLDASDSLARERGLHPYRDAARIFDGMTGGDFAEVVRRAGVKSPSSTTTEAFLGLLKSRAVES